MIVTYSSVRLPVEARYCSCMRVHTQNAKQETDMF